MADPNLRALEREAVNTKTFQALCRWVLAMVTAGEAFVLDEPRLDMYEDGARVLYTLPDYRVAAMPGVIRASDTEPASHEHLWIEPENYEADENGWYSLRGYMQGQVVAEARWRVDPDWREEEESWTYRGYIDDDPGTGSETHPESVAGFSSSREAMVAVLERIGDFFNARDYSLRESGSPRWAWRVEPLIGTDPPHYIPEGALLAPLQMSAGTPRFFVGIRPIGFGPNDPRRGIRTISPSIIRATEGPGHDDDPSDLAVHIHVMGQLSFSGDFQRPFEDVLVVGLCTLLDLNQPWQSRPIAEGSLVATPQDAPNEFMTKVLNSAQLYWAWLRKTLNFGDIPDYPLFALSVMNGRDLEDEIPWSGEFLFGNFHGVEAEVLDVALEVVTAQIRTQGGELGYEWTDDNSVSINSLTTMHALIVALTGVEAEQYPDPDDTDLEEEQTPMGLGERLASDIMNVLGWEWV